MIILKKLYISYYDTSNNFKVTKCPYERVWPLESKKGAMNSISLSKALSWLSFRDLHSENDVLHIRIQKLFQSYKLALLERFST